MSDPASHSREKATPSAPARHPVAIHFEEWDHGAKARFVFNLPTSGPQSTPEQASDEKRGPERETLTIRSLTALAPPEECEETSGAPLQTIHEIPGLWTFIGLALCLIALAVAPYVMKGMEPALP